MVERGVSRLLTVAFEDVKEDLAYDLDSLIKLKRGLEKLVSPL